MRKIIKNKIRCNKCGVELESTYREDFSCCDCGAVAISGGLEYLRRIGQIDKIVEFSEYEVEATVYFPVDGDNEFNKRVLIEEKVIVRRIVKKEDGMYIDDSMVEKETDLSLVINRLTKEKNLELIYATYNPKCNSMDVITSEDRFFRISCREAEADLRTSCWSEGVMCNLAIEKPLEYVRLILTGGMQALLDAEDGIYE